ncbi:glycosyltransferase [Lutibacter sp. A80]|uniref:ATP-grasp fold amidoligase family protein n=1 Tax=Lutibacter sp. A80 TaxID=2918453 RepID=UPI001F0642AD|nr:ATP-grasp fold amidoligase family protein [Lutibacter sp. A80]UMB60985.1 glycosyltransferase [Lutibacter sp. A80]
MKFKKSTYRLLKNFKFLPNKRLLKIRYRYYTDEKLNLENPKKFNEKITWLKLHFHVPLLTQLADKFAVRTYVSEKIGDVYLNELYNVYYSVDAIDFDQLPNQFVLKGVHGSSLNIIVKDKSKLDIKKAKKTMRKWMKHCQYKKVGLEWAYKNIEPKIIAEKYLEEEGKDVLHDYKFFCFNGEPKFLQVDIDRGSKDYRCFYDLDWNQLPFSVLTKTLYNCDVTKPSNFEEMKTLAKTLADDLPFVRVDFYAINNKTIFGEMTFYPGDGKEIFSPHKYNTIIGEYLKLPKIPEEHKIITVF